ncbi:MAG: metallophosphoesterase [Oscillospiraceae bacterium]|nr:metallophosphoesterase [Oscillospiraceae bacterium]
MYRSEQFKQIDEETFTLSIPKDRDFRILQLTDLHLGFGPLSKGADRQALDTVRTLIERAEPHLIVLTGDSIFPFFPRSGTLNNRKQSQKLMEFLDGFEIPYALVFGNHDCEMLSVCDKEELAALYKQGRYCIFTEGRKGLTGVGNFLVELVDESGKVLLPLVMLDSNMYGEGGWFFSGFDRIHDNQVDWCMERLDALKQEEPDIKGMAFFHMPPREMKEAYEKMKLGDKSVIYRHGSIAEKGEYFGISKYRGTFFDRAAENGVIRWMFCGHDHMNTLSLVYRGIQMTYGMSVDCLGYKGIRKSYIQRGGTLITRKADGSVDVAMAPVGPVVSTRVRGVKETR